VKKPWSAVSLRRNEPTRLRWPVQHLSRERSGLWFKRRCEGSGQGIVPDVGGIESHVFQDLIHGVRRRERNLRAARAPLSGGETRAVQESLGSSSSPPPLYLSLQALLSECIRESGRRGFSDVRSDLPKRENSRRLQRFMTEFKNIRRELES
jgi:hypothetical protein